MAYLLHCQEPYCLDKMQVMVLRLTSDGSLLGLCRPIHERILLLPNPRSSTYVLYIKDLLLQGELAFGLVNNGQFDFSLGYEAGKN